MTSRIGTLMMVVDGDHPGAAELKHIGAFASELGARIVGVAASEYAPSLYFAAGAVATDLLEVETRRMEEYMSAAEKRCRQVLGEAPGLTWRSAVSLPIDFVLREARAADLLVCFARKNAPLYSDVDAGELVLKAGRPVLVIPPSAAWRSPQRILIAWKDARESRRAVLDALPFLRRARTVGIVEIIESDEKPRAAEARLRDLAAWLKSHAVEARPQVIAPRGDPLGAFADAAKEFRPDWIVAGAYGRSRLGEWIFGGFTRYLLTQSNVPIYLSH
jgi:nucleotide-binding universal stress UspA family protein